MTIYGERMLSENWLSLGVLSFTIISAVSALLASCTTLFYRNKAGGQISHSQLRIKQGNATLEHRLNVFALSLIFNFASFRIYFFSFLLWIVINFSHIFFRPTP